MEGIDTEMSGLYFILIKIFELINVKGFCITYMAKDKIAFK